MTAARRLIVLAAALTGAFAGAVQAQTPPRPGATAMDQHLWQADRHRMEMDRLRLQADQRELQARQFELEARLNRREIEARRQPDLYIPSAPTMTRSPEQERAARDAAARRRQAAGDVGQIDAWLDRRPN